MPDRPATPELLDSPAASPVGATPKRSLMPTRCSGLQDLTPPSQKRANNAISLAGSGADERLLRCLCGGANAELTAATCRPLVSEVVRQHPSLPFLAADVVYRTHYEATVVHRILFSLDPLRTGRVSAATLRRTGAPLWGALRALSGEGAASDDINCERRFFSYEHFYVIFCKFCELDADGDFELSLEELHRYGGYALSTRAIGRVFVELAGSPREAIEAPNGGISYGAFVYFLLCEEDKASATARSFWFRVLDVDADGVLSADDLRHFYDEQAARLTSLGHEPTDFGHDEDEDGEWLEDADGDVAMLVPPMSGTGSGFGVSNAACGFGGRGGSFGLVRAACANPALLSGSDACEAPF
ncbi:serine threonine-protein phosphatase 2a regulatory subunit b subunit alpha [Chrysochromulina tobinii]|uniref:Serine threonine-protein phosphatase 2a regulatory subunit b subunit alpha n=1 Tax=Chrysochromulina tobinii TaxID=1460289 RepID=A0A0M0K886_9EUKA|nr:serine threonine-protein phosphatase 2a regulatory subunit b subunit alpha [Chrysochromulina tobinii]|eukprot:KOO35071.1 serine threonine-protein phosphatase 2a regulatory subunit b subunit alpha [Chrysochromulina sp. CCMP291]